MRELLYLRLVMFSHWPLRGQWLNISRSHSINSSDSSRIMELDTVWRRNPFYALVRDCNSSLKFGSFSTAAFSASSASTAPTPHATALT